MAEDKAAQLAIIANEINVCTQCRLHSGRTKTVPGAGNPDAEILFIGEGPGANEDKQGLPFVGRSGDYLTYLLNLVNLHRDQVFITNVVKCRPPENRDPLPDEIITCKSYLDRQIEIIDPLVIATLGRFSMARYFPNASITRIHGQPHYDGDTLRAYYPCFHPAAALRNPALRRDMEADFHRLHEVVEQVKAMRAGQSPAPDAPAEQTPDKPDDDTPPEKPIQLRLF